MALLLSFRVRATRAYSISAGGVERAVRSNAIEIAAHLERALIVQPL